MIKISQTYEIVTDESAECGDAAERGFDFENDDFGFRELVDKIKKEGFNNPSCSHGVPRWLSTDSEQDFESGDYESKSIHPGQDAQSQKYWAKACKAAGVIKGV